MPRLTEDAENSPRRAIHTTSPKWLERRNTGSPNRAPLGSEGTAYDNAVDTTRADVGMSNSDSGDDELPPAIEPDDLKKHVRISDSGKDGMSAYNVEQDDFVSDEELSLAVSPGHPGPGSNDVMRTQIIRQENPARITLRIEIGPDDSSSLSSDDCMETEADNVPNGSVFGGREVHSTDEMNKLYNPTCYPQHDFHHEYGTHAGPSRLPSLPSSFSGYPTGGPHSTGQKRKRFATFDHETQNQRDEGPSKKRRQFMQDGDHDLPDVIPGGNFDRATSNPSLSPHSLPCSGPLLPTRAEGYPRSSSPRRQLMGNGDEDLNPPLTQADPDARDAPSRRPIPSPHSSISQSWETPTLPMEGPSSSNSPGRKRKRDDSRTLSRPEGYNLSPFTPTPGPSRKKRQHSQDGARFSQTFSEDRDPREECAPVPSTSAAAHNTDNSNNAEYWYFCPYPGKKGELCNKRFTSIGNFNRHHQDIHGPKLYKCGKCGKGFAFVHPIYQHGVSLISRTLFNYRRKYQHEEHELRNACTRFKRFGLPNDGQ